MTGSLYYIYEDYSYNFIEHTLYYTHYTDGGALSVAMFVYRLYTGMSYISFLDYFTMREYYLKSKLKAA